jgi:PAS domain-containing protein
MLRSGRSVLALGTVSVACVAMFATAMSYSSVHRGVAMASGVLFTLLLVGQLLAAVNSQRQSLRDRATSEMWQRQFVATAATSGGWVYVINPDGRFVYSSDASREFIGYEPRDLLGREARSLLSPVEAQHVDDRTYPST